MQLCSLYTYMSPNLVPPRKKTYKAQPFLLGIWPCSQSHSRRCRMYQLCVGPAIDFVLPRYRSWLGASWNFFPTCWNEIDTLGPRPKLWEHSGVNNLFISNLGRCSCTRFISSVIQVFQKIPWSVNLMRKRRESKQYIHFVKGILLTCIILQCWGRTQPIQTYTCFFDASPPS